MKKRVKNLLSVFGVIFFIMGISILIPSYLNNNILGFGLSLASVIIGGVLFAIVFGE